LIMSGFDHTEVDRIIAAFGRFTEARRVTEENWIALHLQQ
jgi:hypothetical protein